MDGKAEALVKRVAENCDLLYYGYREKVDYVVEVAYHRGDCRHYGKSSLPKNDCECPVVNEKRVRNTKRPGYLSQLREFSKHKDTDRNPKAERGAPRVKTAGRPPGDMGGFFALDEILCDIPTVVMKVILECGRDPLWVGERSATEILRNLSTLVGYIAEDRMDQAEVIDGAVAGWVARSRSTLMITASSSIFDGVVCGNCGGGLSTPWGNRGETDVVCIGSPSDPPCGHTYPASEWITLYQGTSQ